RGDDGNLAFFEGLQKIVLGLNRGAAPAAGAVKFDDDVRAFFHLDVVHAVFQRVERVEAARAAPAQCLGGGENHLRKNLKEIVRHSCILEERARLNKRRAMHPGHARGMTQKRGNGILAEVKRLLWRKASAFKMSRFKSRPRESPIRCK